MAKVISLKQAVQLIQDGQTIAIMGSGGGVNEPTSILKAIGERYQKEHLPRDLTLYHACGIGDKDSCGTDAVAYEGLVKRDIAGYWGMAPKMARLAMDEKIEAYNFPQGVASQMYRAVAGHKPGVITKTGLYTFIDPRLEGGKMNERTTEDLIRVIELGGEEWLWYPTLHFDIGLVRGTTADCHGNLTCEEEAATVEGISLAQAVHNCGGTVIAQVKYLSDQRAHPKDVTIPGIYVDYIVVDPKQKQTCDRVYDPALAGNVRTPFEDVPPMKMGIRKVIARRAARELPPGEAVVNLGVGMPDGVAAVASEDGYLDKLHLTVESGVIGGLPMPGIIFGTSHNPDAIIDMNHQFDFYDGGGLDACFLGMAQLDAYGNVNSSKTGSMLTGCGGAINISQGAKKVIFCGTFTAKGLEAEVGDGKIRIIKEGSIRKMVQKVAQITFSEKYARMEHQQVLYVTERAVFQLEGEGLVLTEIAPGIDMEKDILNHMDFRPIISKQLKLMDRDIFTV